MIDLDELERLHKAATEGEWVAQGWGDGSTPDGVTNIFNHDAEVLLMECLPIDDASLLVALHNAAPELIAAARERDALRVENGRLREALICPPKHKYWGAGEPDCPREIKAGNGELHTLRCKVCGEDSPRNPICQGAL